MPENSLYDEIKSKKSYANQELKLEYVPNSLSLQEEKYEVWAGILLKKSDLRHSEHIAENITRTKGTVSFDVVAYDTQGDGQYVYFFVLGDPYVDVNILVKNATIYYQTAGVSVQTSTELLVSNFDFTLIQALIHKTHHSLLENGFFWADVEKEFVVIFKDENQKDEKLKEYTVSLEEKNKAIDDVSLTCQKYPKEKFFNTIDSIYEFDGRQIITSKLPSGELIGFMGIIDEEYIDVPFVGVVPKYRECGIWTSMYRMARVFASQKKKILRFPTSCLMNV